jgi:hypothetical protein
MSKSELTKTKLHRRKVDLAERHRAIGIGAVAAVLRCQREKKPDDMSASRQQDENSSNQSASGGAK